RYQFNGAELDLPLICRGGFQNYNYSAPLPEHVHTTGPEISYVMKGFTQWQLASGLLLEQSGGTLAVMPQNLPHRGVEEVLTPCWLFWYILDLRDPETARKNTPFTIAEMKLIFEVFALESCRVLTISPELARHFSRLLELLRQGRNKPWFSAEMRLVSNQIVLGTVQSLQQHSAAKADLLVTQARDYMRRHLTGNPAVDDIAAACGLSESQFARRFTREAGITPADCLQRLRIETACRALRESDVSITELAFRLGFATSQYFASVFKRYTGMTPRDWRKVIGQSGNGSC
ncbi:MAG: AraC family transcriptional regulator, partial [Victivallaceae bacterium]|nr:AraC family transcriptional regulator [Victivallaceae bacterium]